MHSSPLFRSAATSANSVKWLGAIVLTRPISFPVLTALALSFAIIVIGFLILGSYTQRSGVAGFLAPDVGMIKVYTSQVGIVEKKFVSEGQEIHQGDVLYLISSERQGSQGDVQATISRQVTVRQQSLREELRQTRKVQQDEEVALRNRINGMETEHASITNQLRGQQARVELAEDAVKRAGQLLAQGFVSREIMQQKQSDLLDQRSRQQALEREQINVGRELLSQRNDLAGLPLRQRNQLAQLERQLAITDQEWTESEAKRRIAIVAPKSGIATAVTAETGQVVDASKPLLSVVPQGAQLQANLYAPSRAIGFIRPNDSVLLRYQAFPYQKFGHAQGAVVSVSRTALPVAEYSGVSSAVSPNGEPLYRITVRLARQTINAYGKPQPLQPGMLVDADVMLERRRLYEWVLEPLYSLSGKL
ncbi:MAG: HlyD family efflux transporter periplasmic adaptor subunit [Pseudomonadota bacterium]